MGIMRANRLNRVATSLQQLPDATPVASGHLEPPRHYELHKLAAGVHIRLHRVDLTVVAVNIPTVQQPPVIHPQGNAAVPARMSGEWITPCPRLKNPPVLSSRGNPNACIVPQLRW
jgi:hypothetical protein